MKKTILISLLLLVNLKIVSQQKKIELKSFSFALGGFQPYSGGNGNANFYASADLTAKLRKNLFTLSLNRGFDVGLYNFGNRYNLSLDALYGQELVIFNWLKLELHAGVGAFRGSYYKNDSQEWQIVKTADDNQNHITPMSIAFPIKFKMLFYYNKNSSLGTNISGNVNNISNYIAYNIIYQKSF